MARKPNYSFEKNARAKAKADKKEAKRLAKLAAKDDKGEGDDGNDGDTDNAASVAADEVTTPAVE